MNQQLPLFNDAATAKKQEAPRVEEVAGGGFDVGKFMEIFSIMADTAGGPTRLRSLVLHRALARGFSDESVVSWISGTVGDFVTFLNGYAFKSEWFAEDGVRLLRNANVSHGKLDWTDVARLEDSKVEEFSRFSLSAGDIVLTLDRPIISTGVKVARVTAMDLPCLLLQRVAKVSPNTKLITPDFLFLWLTSPLFTGAIDPGRSNGVPHISTRDIQGLPMTLPPLPEQHRIVAKVDALMKLIDDLEARQAKARAVQTRLRTSALEALTKAEGPEELASAWKRVAENWEVLFERAESVGELRQLALRMVFQGRFTNHSRFVSSTVRSSYRPLSKTKGRDATNTVLPGAAALAVGPAEMRIPECWEWLPLVAVARLESGHTPSRNHPEYWDGGIPWIGIRDARVHNNGWIDETEQTVSQAGLDNSSARLLPAGTVCLSRTASVGYVTIMKRPMATSQDFVNWVCGERLLPEFLMNLLRCEAPTLRRFSKGAVHQTIYFPEVKAFHIALPPLEEQKRIVARVDALMKLCDELEARLRAKEAAAGKLVEAVVRELVG